MHSTDAAEHGPECSGQRSFKLKEILALPAAYTKGADALKRPQSTYQRRRISFSVLDFHQLVQRIETIAKAVKRRRYYCSTLRIPPGLRIGQFKNFS
jgi:hypothetical protein